MKAYKILRVENGTLWSFTQSHDAVRQYQRETDNHFPKGPAFCFRDMHAARRFREQYTDSWTGYELWEVDIDPVPTPDRILTRINLYWAVLYDFWQGKKLPMYRTFPTPKGTICASRVRLVRQVDPPRCALSILPLRQPKGGLAK